MNQDMLMKIAEAGMQRAAEAFDIMEAEGFQATAVLLNGQVVTGTYIGEAEHTGNLTLKAALSFKADAPNDLNAHREHPLITIPGRQIMMISHGRVMAQEIRSLYEGLKA